MAPKSRWADDDADAAFEAKRKAEKEAKKRARAEKQRLAEEAEAARQTPTDGRAAPPPSKRRRLTPQPEAQTAEEQSLKLLSFQGSTWGQCRHIDNFEKLNHIEEGSYGWVSRARETATGEIVALKKLKMEYNGNDGFPVTGLREIQTLMASRHPNIVTLREIVMGDTMNDVYLVMGFLEHDLRTLAETMSDPFSASEVKTILQQLTSAVDYLHSNWILHRDLKTSNLLMNNRGQVKLADFGMARYFGDPSPRLTQLVVTLWYRSPELILGAETYSTEIDIWSVGCIFGELLTNEPLLQGKNEVGQLAKIFELCGIPDDASWPEFRRLPNAKSLRLPSEGRASSKPAIRSRFPQLTNAGCSLLGALLSLNPARRPSAAEMLKHPYFREDPRPKSQAMFPTFPSKAGQERRRKIASPSAPIRGAAPAIGGQNIDFSSIFDGRDDEENGGGFRLRLV